MSRTRNIAILIGIIVACIVIVVVALVAVNRGGADDSFNRPDASSQVNHSSSTNESAAADTDNVSTVPDPDETASTGVQDSYDYVQNQVVIQVKADTSDEDILGALEDAGAESAQIEVVFEDADADFKILEVTYSGDSSPEEIIDKIEGYPFIDYAEPNIILTALADPAPAMSAQTTEINDRYATSGALWHLTNTGAYDAWDTAQCNGEVTIAVIDTGVDIDHEDLVDNLILDYAKDTYTNEVGALAVDDVNGHGTSVCGMAAAVTNNAVGVAGISYNAKILPIRATHVTTTGYAMSLTDLVEGLDYVVDLKTDPESPQELKNIRVVNVSFGARESAFGSSLEHYREMFEPAFERCNEAGIIVVCAAGNYGNSNNEVVYPAAWSNTVAVASITGDNVVAPSSSYGDFVDIAAPGVSVYTTRYGGGYARTSGTSFSAPLVSGALAVMYSCNKDAAVNDVVQALYDTATDLGDTGKDVYYGYGAINLSAAVDAMGLLPEQPDVANAIVGEVAPRTYDGTAYKPALEIRYNGENLVEGIDYTVEYTDNVHAGTASAHVEGTGRFMGDTTISFSINQANLAATYVGETIEEGEEPALRVTVGGFVNGEDEESALGYVAPTVSKPVVLYAGTSHKLTPSGGAAQDYSFTYVPGWLVVAGSMEPEEDVLDGYFDIYGGATRYDTARMVNSDIIAAAGESVAIEGIIVVSGRGSGTSGKFADALSAAGLSGVTGYPVVMVDGEKALSEHEEATLTAYREAAGGKDELTVLILGADDSVSQAVQDEIEATYGTVPDGGRVAGKDRYETNYLMWQWAVDNGYTWNKEYAFVAKGNDFPDALSIAPFLAFAHCPLVLVDRRSTALSEAQSSMLEGVDEVIVLGDTSSVTEELATSAGCATRLFGEGRTYRYGTSAAIASWALEHGMRLQGAGIAKGTDFPDALGSATLLGTNRTVLLLINPADTEPDGNDPTTGVLARAQTSSGSSVESLRIFGDPASVPERVYAQLSTALGWSDFELRYRQ